MSCIAICGDSASGKTVMANLLAYNLFHATVLECDRYHKWGRQDARWKQCTHLNPFANNIDLMNLDVLRLKSGKSIRRCDYDHSVGEFTSEHEIKPSAHLVVCGLHTFICSDDLYDLKIFMDADVTLKTEWKIVRDMTKRGYKIEQVEDQIKRRRLDFECFVRPLMQRADIIVNFRSKLDLRLLIHERYDVSGWLQRLSIDHTVSKQGHMTQVDIKTGTNYDCIVACVLEVLKSNV